MPIDVSLEEDQVQEEGERVVLYVWVCEGMTCCLYRVLCELRSYMRLISCFEQSLHTAPSANYTRTRRRCKEMALNECSLCI